MNPTRSKQTLLVSAATLGLAGILGFFPHGHVTIFPGPSERCPGADAGAHCADFHVSEAEPGNGADGCTICFFSRCASQATAAVFWDFVVALDETKLVCASGAAPVRNLASQNEARGPPAA